jgi:hypothetical protein
VCSLFSPGPVTLGGASVSLPFRWCSWGQLGICSGLLVLIKDLGMLGIKA